MKVLLLFFFSHQIYVQTSYFWYFFWNFPSRPIFIGQGSQKQWFFEKMRRFCRPISGRIWPETKKYIFFRKVDTHTFQKSIYCWGWYSTQKKLFWINQTWQDFTQLYHGPSIGIFVLAPSAPEFSVTPYSTRLAPVLGGSIL